MSFSIIAAVGKNRELGSRGSLCFSLPADLKYFKKTTLGHKCLMGYRTFASLPRKLSGREILVASYETVDGADETITNLDKFIAENEDSKDEIFVCGGGMIYKELLPHCKKLYLTEIDEACEVADTFFPEFDKSLYDKKVINKGKENDLAFSFAIYTKK